MSVSGLSERRAPARASAKPFVSISVLTPKPGRFGEFLALQLAQHHRLRGTVPGLLGGRLFRSVDERNLILVTMFETAEAAAEFRKDQRFMDHFVKVQPLLENAVQGVYEAAYQVGEL